MEHLHHGGILNQEYLNCPARCHRIAEPSHTRTPLAATHGRHEGQTSNTFNF